MAGEDFTFDMSLIDFNSEEPEDKVVDTTQEITNTNEIADAEKQENVGEDRKEEDLKEKEEETNDPDSPAAEDVFEPLASFLKEQGFFSDLDIKIKNEEDLAEAFRQEIKKNELADLNELQREYLEALREGVPSEVIQSHQKTRTIFENITDDILSEDEEIRKQLIINDRLASGFDQSRAERDYKRIFDAGESYEEAKASRDNLKLKEAQEYENTIKLEKQNELEQKKRAEEQVNNLKKAVFEEDNFLGSFKVDQGLKQRVYDTMTKVVEYSQQGEPLNKLMKHRLEDPVGFEKSLYYMYDLTNGFKDINKFINKSNTTASKKLRDAIQNSTYIKSGGSSVGLDDQDSYDSPIVSLID